MTALGKSEMKKRNEEVPAKVFLPRQNTVENLACATLITHCCDERWFLHDVQYNTCDHSCVVSAGFTSERVSRVCRAVRKEVTSAGEGGGGASEKRDWMGVAADEARAREKLCFKEEKPREVELDILPDGEDGRLGLGGPGGTPGRTEVGGMDGGGAFFFPVKGRRNAHSDSNWTESNSDARGT